MALAILLSSSQAQAAPPETMPIWRARVYFQTFNAPDAGSDDSVRVELGASNGTWVDSPFDDWETGAGRTYDLRLDGINRLSDIDYFRISKPGSGGWCIGRIRLLINGVALYDEQFPSGLWLDNSGGHSTVYFIDDFFMRQRAEWINYVVPTRSDIVPVGDMRSRIEALFGDFLTSTNGDLGFRGSSPVGIWTLDANSWRVNVDISDIKLFFPDQDVDVDFDLTVAWTGSFIVRPDLRVENLNVDYTWPAYGGGAQYFMNNDFMPRLNAMMKNFTYLSRTGIQLAPNGDLHFLPIAVSPEGPITIGAFASEPGRITRAVAIPNDNRSPLVLRVGTASNIKPFEETTFTAVVKSNLNEDAEVDVTFGLPAEVSVSGASIGANDATGTRWLTPVIQSQSNGATSITLRDRLATGKETTYTLRLTFVPGDEKASLINTYVAPASVGKVGPLSATTYFRMDSGSINSEGTMIKR
jgi:hypothetical protein